MKLIITTLTMIFLTFGASASLNIETLYKYCKIYQNNGFVLKGLDQTKSLKSAICSTELRTMTHGGDANCQMIKEIYTKTTDKFYWGVFATLRANDRKQSVNQVIMSFINFAEKNPKLWKETALLHSAIFLGKKFPCDYKNP